MHAQIDLDNTIEISMYSYSISVKVKKKMIFVTKNSVPSLYTYFRLSYVILATTTAYRTIVSL